MSLKSFIVPRAAQKLLGEDRLNKQRKKFERGRMSNSEAHKVEFFHDPSDPYSQLLEKVLPRFAENYKIELITVSHAPVHPAFGYRIDYKDRSVAISGDTAYDPNIATASKDVDVLFHEALNMEMVKTMQAAAKANGVKGLEKILFDIQDYHTSPVDAAKIAKQANANDLVLYHIVPMLPSDALIPMFVRGASDEFDGKITVSEDGTIVRLPVDSEAIIYEHGL